MSSPLAGDDRIVVDAVEEGVIVGEALKPGERVVPGDLLRMLWGLDGTRQLGAVLADLPSEKRAEGLAVARRLVELGFAEPAAV